MNCKTQKLESPIHLAISEKMIELLLKHGTSIDEKDFVSFIF